MESPDLHIGVLGLLTHAVHNVQIQQHSANELQGNDGVMAMGHDDCFLSVDANAGGGVSFIQCGSTKIKMEAHVDLWHLAGSFEGRDFEECFNCSFEWAVVPRGGCYNWLARGLGYAHPNYHGPYEDTHYCE